MFEKYSTFGHVLHKHTMFTVTVCYRQDITGFVKTDNKNNDHGGTNEKFRFDNI